MRIENHEQYHILKKWFNHS